MKNFFLLTFILVLTFSPLHAFGIAEVTPEADKKELCPSLKYLFKDSQMERYQTFENTSSFCPEIEKTCCTKQDFIALSNWWQTNKVSGSTCSRQAIRQHNTHSIIYYQIRQSTERKCILRCKK